jgi:circadian clock protein KaiC
MHVSTMHKLIEDFKPAAVIIDPLTNLINVGSPHEVRSALLRLIDLIKLRQITGVFTSLTHEGQGLETTDIGVSSLMDTWLLVRDLENSGERNRGIYVLKSRGMSHSNQIREFRLTDHGIELANVYLGSAGLLVGAAREAQEAKERAETLVRQQELELKQRQLDRKRQVVAAQIKALQASFESEQDEVNRSIQQGQLREDTFASDRKVMARLRHSGAVSPAPDRANGAGDNHEKDPQRRARKKGKVKAKTSR